MVTLLPLLPPWRKFSVRTVGQGLVLLYSSEDQQGYPRGCNASTTRCDGRASSRVEIGGLRPAAAGGGAGPFSGGKRLQQDWQVPSDVRVLPGLATLPKDSQLLSRTQTGGTLSPQLQREMKQLNGDTVLRVGIPWDPIEFINKAGKTGHPFHQLSKMNKPLEELIEQLVHRPSSVRSRRKSYLDKWTKRSRVLEPEEEKLKSSMSKHRKHGSGLSH